MAFALMDFQNLNTAQHTGVVGLTAAVGIKCSLIQNHVKTLFALLAGEYIGGEGSQIGISFIQFFHIETFFS
jgi:hypothetical protein